jgi:hypothetical protein
MARCSGSSRTIRRSPPLCAGPFDSSPRRYRPSARGTPSSPAWAPQRRGSWSWTTTLVLRRH